LSSFRFARKQVEGHLENTGRGIRFNVNLNSSGQMLLRAGPLSYEYRLSHLILHFGREDDRGSEHTINGQRFPGELQSFFYNSLLYENYTEAEHQPNGVAAMAVLLQMDATSDAASSSRSASLLELSQLLSQTEHIKHKGSKSSSAWRLQLQRLLPTSQYYLTYEGSLTEPPCSESTIWIVLNRPLRVASRQLHSLRHSVVIDGYGDNFRPSQSLTGRCVRTNIINQAALAEQTAASLAEATQKLLLQTAIERNQDDLESLAGQINDSTVASHESRTVKSFCATGNRIGFYSYKGERLT
jgi:hypothetical protein